MPGCVPGAAVLWGSTYRVRPLPQSLSTCCPPCSCPAVLPPTYRRRLHLREGLARTKQAYTCMNMVGLIARVIDRVIEMCESNELGKNQVHHGVSRGEVRLRCITGNTHERTHNTYHTHVHTYTQHATAFRATVGGRGKSMRPDSDSQHHCHNRPSRGMANS